MRIIAHCCFKVKLFKRYTEYTETLRGFSKHVSKTELFCEMELQKSQDIVLNVNCNSEKGRTEMGFFDGLKF